MARSSFDLRSWLLRGVIALVAASFVGFGIMTWLDGQNRTARVEELVQEASDLREFESDLTGARARLEEALDLDRNAWAAHFEMGRLLRALSRDGDAAAAFETAVELAPEDERAPIWLYLGRANQDQLKATGKKRFYTNARMAFDEAQSGPDVAAQALCSLALLEIEARKLPNGERYLRRALEAFERLGRDYPEFDEIDVADYSKKLQTMIERAMLDKEKKSS